MCQRSLMSPRFGGTVLLCSSRNIRWCSGMSATYRSRSTNACSRMPPARALDSTAKADKRGVGDRAARLNGCAYAANGTSFREALTLAAARASSGFLLRGRRWHGTIGLPGAHDRQGCHHRHDVSTGRGWRCARSNDDHRSLDPPCSRPVFPTCLNLESVHVSTETYGPSMPSNRPGMNLWPSSASRKPIELPAAQVVPEMNGPPVCAIALSVSWSRVRNYCRFHRVPHRLVTVRLSGSEFLPRVRRHRLGRSPR